MTHSKLMHVHTHAYAGYHKALILYIVYSIAQFLLFFSLGLLVLILIILHGLYSMVEQSLYSYSVFLLTPLPCSVSISKSLPPAEVTQVFINHTQYSSPFSR